MQKQINKTKKSSKKGTKTAAKSGSAKKTGRKAGTSKNAKSAIPYEAKKMTVRKKRRKRDKEWREGANSLMAQRIFIYLFIYLCLFFLVFLGPYPWHMEVPRLGVQLEL